MISRRKFLKTVPAFGGAFFEARAVSRQLFQAGVIPVGKTTIEHGREEVLDYCDEITRLGFHRFEVNNTRARIAEYYVDRIEEFKKELAARHLALTGLAQYSRAAQGDGLAALLEQHMLIGRFLAGAGGKYITHMLAPGEILNESDEAAYRDLDMKAWVANTNEIGRRLLGEWGIKFGYHPLRAEIPGSIYRRFLELTDARYVFLIADIGHLVAGSADPVEFCKTYRQRIVAVHLKDYSPTPTAEKGTRVGNVPFGQGIANLSGVIAELERTKFSGWVLGESGGTNLAMRDYMVHSLHVNL